MSDIEQVKSEVFLHHSVHPHALNLTVDNVSGPKCEVCHDYTFFGQIVYKCSDDNCGDDLTLHQKCAEMPLEISLSLCILSDYGLSFAMKSPRGVSKSGSLHSICFFTMLGVYTGKTDKTTHDNNTHFRSDNSNIKELFTLSN